MSGRYLRKNLRGKESGSGHEEGYCHVTSSLRRLLGIGFATTASGGSGFTVQGNRRGEKRRKVLVREVLLVQVPPKGEDEKMNLPG